MPPRPAISSTRWPANSSPGARSAMGTVVAPGSAARPQERVHSSRFIRGVKPLRSLLLAALVAGLTLPSAANAATAGVNITELPPSDTVKGELAALKPQTIRTFMQPGKNADPNYDAFVDFATSIGAQPLFVVVDDPASPPTTDGAIKGFVNFIAHHVQRQVNRGHKGLAWEIWNEEDAPKWWAGAPDINKPDRDASAYVRLLSESYKAIKQIDSTATVVLGGVTGNDYAFVNSVYANQGGAFFDAAASHTDTACAIGSPYGYFRDVAGGPISQWAFLGYRSIHDVMAANGDGDKPIWLTEIGWSTTTQSCAEGMWAGKKAGGVSQADQATFIGQAYHCLSFDPYVQKALVFRLLDGAGGTMEDKYGIAGKPAFAAVQAAAAGSDKFAGEECGDFTAPTISIAQPTDGAVFATSLPIKVSANDGSGVARISLFYDDKSPEIRNFTPGTDTAPSSLSGGLDWQGGKQLSLGAHKLTVQAVDPMGNVASRSVTVTKVDLAKLPKIKTQLKLKLQGKGGKRVLRIQVKPKAKGLTNLLGKINLVFAKKVKGRWKVAHKYGSMAKGYERRSKAFKVKLERAQWRVSVTYSGSPRYARAVSSLKFKVR